MITHVPHTAHMMFRSFPPLERGMSAEMSVTGTGSVLQASAVSLSLGRASESESRNQTHPNLTVTLAKT